MLRISVLITRAINVEPFQIRYFYYVTTARKCSLQLTQLSQPWCHAEFTVSLQNQFALSQSRASLCSGDNQSESFHQHAFTVAYSSFGDVFASWLSLIHAPVSHRTCISISTFQRSSLVGHRSCIAAFLLVEFSSTFFLYVGSGAVFQAVPSPMVKLQCKLREEWKTCTTL